MHSKLAGSRVMVIDDSNNIWKSAEIFLRVVAQLAPRSHGKPTSKTAEGVI